ncbi:hypothetical protein [Altererythrobacter sp. GH1-8]|uniref:hypothetical protein n=1 Tax=Altererythrobacter sp. GH1-8 TaxID=3349333 RepID=UPI00374D8128
MAVVLILALVKGGTPERIGVGLLVGVTSLQAILYATVPPRFTELDLIAGLADLAFFLGFGWLAIKAKRAWPICASAFQIISLASHVAREIQIQIEPMAYSIMKSTPTGMAIILIGIGTVMHMRRLNANGEDADWTDWNRLRLKRSRLGTDIQSSI